jgi:serine/threonine-protein kinase
VAITPRSIDAGVGIGEIFVDKYRVDAFLGHGGMGIVALCTHLGLNERVAIKMLRRDVLDDADAVERFMREAQAAVKLKSEFVARVTDVGRSRTNVPYMVMEYLEGHDLGELLDERGSLGLPWAVELTLQACEALAEAHSLGIVHRDVKPTNLFVTWRPDGSALIKVLDFGISKALTGNAMRLTQTQSLLGTPAYMSPEQMRSARMVDARTDIWSLGTVLYEMLEGHRPFEAESFSEMCVKVAVDAPDPMTATPLALQQVVLRCLEKSPEQRYASMADLARDLVPFSQDPHQAQVLVERMSRTLRRSQVLEWSSSPGSVSGAMRAAPSGTSAPMSIVVADASGSVRVARSAETGAVDPAGATAVAGAPLGAAPVGSAPAILLPEPVPVPSPVPSPARPSGSGPAVAVPAVGRRSGPRSAVSETMAVTRPPRRVPVAITVAIAAVVVAAAAIGVAISLARTPPRDPPGARPEAVPASRPAPPRSAAPGKPPGGSTDPASPPGEPRAAHAKAADSSRPDGAKPETGPADPAGANTGATPDDHAGAHAGATPDDHAGASSGATPEDFAGRKTDVKTGARNATGAEPRDARGTAGKAGGAAAGRGSALRPGIDCVIKPGDSAHGLPLCPKN